MKRFQSLLASFVLTIAFAVSAPAGIIHTGSPEEEPPPASSSESDTTDDGVAEGETAEADTTTFDLLFEAALDCLHGTLTLF